MNKLVAALFGATLMAGAVGPSRAADAGLGPTVIELFTSQGCSSCPPADALMQTLAKRSDLVALSLPVDYWDNLGWKDTLASPAYTARQRAYARQRGDGEVYTPQMVVGGMLHAVGSDQRGIERAIEAAQAKLKSSGVTLAITGQGGDRVVDVAARQGGGSRKATLWIATVRPDVKVAIGRGENQGASVHYINTVREMSSLSTWSGEALSLKVPANRLPTVAGERCAVFLQEGEAGPILAAAWVQ